MRDRYGVPVKPAPAYIWELAPEAEPWAITE